MKEVFIKLKLLVLYKKNGIKKYKKLHICIIFNCIVFIMINFFYLLLIKCVNLKVYISMSLWAAYNSIEIVDK